MVVLDILLYLLFIHTIVVLDILLYLLFFFYESSDCAQEILGRTFVEE
jgi:hypothetical protein